MSVGASADPTIDLNADVGEGFDDAGVARAVSSLNIACGGHAGDERTMRAALALAREFASPPARTRLSRPRTVRPCGDWAPAGRHRRYRAAPGRRAARSRRECGLRLAHVKPHGALYHRASGDAEAARAIASSVAALDRELVVVGFPARRSSRRPRRRGSRSRRKGFVDRATAPTARSCRARLPARSFRVTPPWRRRSRWRPPCARSASTPIRRARPGSRAPCAAGSRPRVGS